MSQLEKITGELRSMREALREAQTRAAGAAVKSREIATRAAGTGFVGVATALAGLTQKIEQVQAMIGAAGSSVEQSAAAVSAAPPAGAAEQTIAALTPASQQLDRAQQMIGGTVDTVEQARRLTATVLQGGQPGPMLALLESIKQCLTQTAIRGLAATKEMQAGIAEARMLGSLGN